MKSPKVKLTVTQLKYLRMLEEFGGVAPVDGFGVATLGDVQTSRNGAATWLRLVMLEFVIAADMKLHLTMAGYERIRKTA